MKTSTRSYVSIRVGSPLALPLGAIGNCSDESIQDLTDSAVPGSPHTVEAVCYVPTDDARMKKRNKLTMSDCAT